VVSHHGTVRDAAEFGVLRVVGLLAAVFPLAGLTQVLANLHDYRQPAVAIAVWLLMFPVAVRLVPRVRTSTSADGLAGPDGLTRSEAVAAVLIAVAAVAVIGWEYRMPDSSGGVDLAILGTAWLLAIVALSCPASVWIPGALIVFTVHAVLLVRASGADPLGLTELEAAGYILVIVLAAFSVLRPTIAMHTSISARHARLTSRSVAERAAAVAIQADRRNRLALLEMEALPLLRAIADGSLDPAASEVRERCARHAAALRHSLTDRAPRAEGLMAALELAGRVAGARGVLADAQIIGDPGITAPEVTRAVVTAVDAVLSTLPPQQVTLIVIAPGDAVELYVTFGEALRLIPDLGRPGRDLPTAAGWHASLTTEDTGPGCLEVVWRKAVPRDGRH
jgi:hypothetical protein